MPLAHLTGDYPTAQARHALRCRCAWVRGFEVQVTYSLFTLDTYRYTHWPCAISLSSTLGVSESCSLSGLFVAHEVATVDTTYRFLVEPRTALNTARRFPI